MWLCQRVQTTSVIRADDFGSWQEDLVRLLLTPSSSDWDRPLRVRDTLF